MTTGFGVLAYRRASRSVALSGALDWLKQFTHVEVESTVNSQLQLSEGSTTRAGSVNSATRWIGAGRRLQSLYPTAHLSLWHDVSAGIEGLMTVGGGLGAHLRNEPTPDSPWKAVLARPANIKWTRTRIPPHSSVRNCDGSSTM